MSQPPEYTRQADFTDYQTNNPGQPMSGASLDTEFNALKTTTDAVRANMAILQRDDTAMANAVVHPDAFTTASLALIASDWTPRGLWATTTAYVVGDLVEENGGGYVCAEDHTAGTFTTDYNAGKWISLVGTTQVNSVTNLRGISPTSERRIYLKAHTTEGDGGHGYFRGVTGAAASTYVDNGGTIIVPTGGDGSTAWLRETPGSITVSMFGARPDDLSYDSGPAINNAFDYLRTLVTAQTAESALDSAIAQLTIDLEGHYYRSDESINACGIVGWNWVIENGMIVSYSTGKPAIAGLGSRGGTWRNIYVYGDDTSTPTHGLLFARSTTVGFCDGHSFDNCGTLGYFSTSGFTAYAQESTHYNHCRWWNYDRTGYAAIYTRSDISFPAGTFDCDYATAVTGSHSYIQNQYSNIDHRLLPHNRAWTVNAVTNANPAVVTTAAVHGLSNGDSVTFGPVSGMTEIQNQLYTVANVTATTFELSGVDSTAYGIFTGTATVYHVNTKPCVYMSSGNDQHIYISCYFVAYGTSNIRYDFVDAVATNNWYLDALFEGYGGSTHIAFTNVDGNSVDRQINNWSLLTYALKPRVRTFSLDGATYKVKFNGPEIIAPTKHSVASTFPDLFSDVETARVDMKDARINIGDSTTLTDEDIDAYDGFTGRVSYVDTANSVVRETLDFIDISGDITVSADTGSITAYAINTAVAQYRGKRRRIYLVITLTTIGTATGGMIISGLDALATAAASANVGVGRHASDGSMLQIFWASGVPKVVKYDNSTPFTADGHIVRLTLDYEAQ